MKKTSISRKERKKKKERTRKQNKDYSLFIPFVAIQIIFLSFIILEHVNSGLRI